MSPVRRNCATKLSEGDRMTDWQSLARQTEENRSTFWSITQKADKARVDAYQEAGEQGESLRPGGPYHHGCK
jgi:hypothetical protein